MVMRNQIGATSPTFGGILILLAVTAFIALKQTGSEVSASRGEVVETLRGETLERINALQSCFDETRDWCSVEQLEDYGISEAVAANSVVTNQVVNGDNITLTVRAPSDAVAGAFAKFVRNPVVTGSTVVFDVEPPTKSHIFQDQIQKYADDEFGRNTLERTVEFDSHDLSRVKEASAKRATFNTLTADSHTIGTLTVNEEVQLGTNSLGFSGNQINVSAETSRITGSATVNGDIDLNGNNVSQIQELSARELSARRLQSSRGSLDHVSGDDIAYTTAEIDSITAQRYQSDEYQAARLNADSVDTETVSANLNAESGNVTQIGYNQANGTNWTYANAGSSQVRSQRSEIGVSTAQSLNLSNRASGSRLATSSSRYTSLSVLGTSSGGQYTSRDDFSTSRSSVNRNFDLTVQQGNDIERNENDIASTRGKIQAESSKVAANRNDIGEATTDMLANRELNQRNQADAAKNESDIDDVADSLNGTADKLDMWQGRLDKCMYQTQYCIPQDPSVSLSCPNCVQSKEQSSFTARATATITQCRQGCSYSWSVSGSINGSCSSGTIPKGGSATPSCDVSKSGLGPQQRATGTVSIVVNNSHYTDRTESKSVGVNFFNKTVPNPLVATSCVGCNQSQSRSSFNASIRADISQCGQGCSYSWSVSGGAGGSCPSGTVSAGSSKSVSCDISGSVAAGDSSSGTVSIVVRNSVSTSYTDTDSESYNWNNLTAANPFSGVVAGCYWDTSAYDTTSEGGCFTQGNGGFTEVVTFTVGDITGVKYTFSDSSKWSIIWSGGCTSSQSQCDAYTMTTTGPSPDRVNASVTVRHLPTGEQKTFDVSALYTKQH